MQWDHLAHSNDWKLVGPLVYIWWNPFRGKLAYDIIINIISFIIILSLSTCGMIGQFLWAVCHCTAC